MSTLPWTSEEAMASATTPEPKVRSMRSIDLVLISEKSVAGYAVMLDGAIGVDAGATADHALAFESYIGRGLGGLVAGAVGVEAVTHRAASEMLGSVVTVVVVVIVAHV